MRPLLSTVCLLALALASAPAAALGLGQIQVLSAPGEPLVAEIPVITNDASELIELRASLASPETFTRVGLQPPIGVVADLRFTLATDRAKRPVIRVTSPVPVTQPVLTFLVEVDWGQGRLVREYSAVVAAPGSIASEAVEPVQAPAVAAPQVIERPAAVATVPPGGLGAPPTPAPAARPVQPEPAVSGDPAAYRVRPGDTLSRIAGRVAPEGATPEQTMVGLLRANPQAFIDGDINQLRRGAVLRVPASAELEAVEAREAATLVRTYSRRWREARTQPQAPVPTPQRTVVQSAPEPAGRLEIVPPGAGQAAVAGTQSGIAAGGEGEMLRQELQQTKEALAARDAELQEMRSRVTELERLQSDQQKLLALKDAEMASAQQRTGQASSDPGYTSVLPWLVAGALVLLGLAAAAWNRRRARSRPAFDPAARPVRPSIADAFPAPDGSAGDSNRTARGGSPSWQAAGAAAVAAPVVPSRATEAPSKVPHWMASTGSAPLKEPAPDTRDSGGSTAVLADAESLPTDVDRLEMAQAHLDLGDRESARLLLEEVARGSDATARTVASRMLRDIE